MPENFHARIFKKAVEIISAAPEGVRYAELRRQLEIALPDIKHNTMSGGIQAFRIKLPKEIQHVSRGMYRHISFADTAEPPATPRRQATTPTAARIKEEDFYSAFAEWLKEELEECTKAIPLGGNRFGGKWGTPDVIGIRAPDRGDLIQFQEEFTSAEIKLDTQDLITAFGQACSYKLFSHRSYMVVPKSSSRDDRDRLTALAQIFGIGLVLYDSAAPKQPAFDIQVRALRHEPDYFYVNKNLRSLKTQLFR